jgi:ABC-2 type transport system permease protein
MWWLIGSLLLGALEGSILNTSLDAMAANPSLLKLIENLGGSSNLASAFIVLMIGIFALAACGYGIATLLRLRQDETSGRAELALSTPTARAAWASGHIVTGYIGAAMVVVMGGLGSGAVYGTSIGAVPTTLGHAIGAALITVPAIWAVLGITVLALGITPHRAFVGWIALAWCVVAGWFGVILGLPDWILKTSPFGHLPGWPGAPMNWAPDLILLAITALMLVSALRGLLRRDIPQ